MSNTNSRMKEVLRGIPQGLTLEELADHKAVKRTLRMVRAQIVQNERLEESLREYVTEKPHKKAKVGEFVVRLQEPPALKELEHVKNLLKNAAAFHELALEQSNILRKYLEDHAEKVQSKLEHK